MSSRIVFLIALVGVARSVFAQDFIECSTPGFVASCPFVSGSTESVKNLAPLQNTEIDLAAEQDGDGILRYNNVTIPAGVTVTFKRNPANTPLVLLARGDVMIAGTLDVRGGNGDGAVGGDGGPGGFDGGRGGITTPGIGLGPGAGCHANSDYLNARPIPLLGGSGGNGTATGGGFGFGGGGGGGAVLIASSGDVSVTGSVNASLGFPAAGGSCRGSAGAVRIIGNRVNYSGSLFAEVGRIEACDPASTSGTCVQTCSGCGCSGRFSFDCATPAFVSSLPTLRITSVAGTAAPIEPVGSYNGDPDIALPEGTTSVNVAVAATGIPPGTMVTIAAVPRLGAKTTANASLMGTTMSSTGSANVTLLQGRSLITAEATVNITPGSGAPLIIGGIAGERIASLKIGASYGGGSSLVYVTESGREIPADPR
jgi:hypothetical protein